MGIFCTSLSPGQALSSPDVGKTMSTTDAMSDSYRSEQTDVDDVASMSHDTDTDELQQSTVTVISLELPLSSSGHFDPVSSSTSSDLASSNAEVPRTALRLAATTEQTQNQSAVTTLMLRNLPRMLHQQQLLDELNRSGFVGCYDFCYMPCDFEVQENQGIAFVNFTSSFRAAEVRRAWHRIRCFGADTTAISVVPAAVQGLEANWRTFGARLRRVRNPRFRPFFFGVPQDASSTTTAAAASAPPVAHRQDAAYGVAKPLARGSGDRRPHGPGGNQKAVDGKHAASSHSAPRAARLIAAGHRGAIR
mmetsp:Transcript_14479/g.46800  ORF Transcript_14479/g.46800 Transcript_14479/m.46800 type:complete len:306 (-) Transcript_14479:407-1324(-)